MIIPMNVDVDGAPNAYGPAGLPTLDDERNARYWVNRQPTDRVAGYRTHDGTCRTPILQGPADPFPGYYISTSGYEDVRNANENDPRRYVNAAEINYTVLGTAAQQAGVLPGDFCTVHSLRTRFVAYAIVGDTGNSSGAEGSLALLQRLGYTVRDGRSGSVEQAEIVVRHFPGSNPAHLFFHTQADLEDAARSLDLDIDFSEFHPGDPGKLILQAVAASDPAAGQPGTPQI